MKSSHKSVKREDEWCSDTLQGREEPSAAFVERDKSSLMK